MKNYLIYIYIGIYVGAIFYSIRFPHRQRNYYECCTAVIKRGDIDAYYDKIFYATDRERDLYTIILITQYHNYYLCYLLDDLTTWNINHSTTKPDSQTVALSLYFLNLGAVNGNSDCVRRLSNLYKDGKYVPKDTMYANKLKSQYDSLIARNKLKGR